MLLATWTKMDCFPLTLVLILLGIGIGFVQGQCKYAGGGWNFRFAECGANFTEVFLEQDGNLTLRYCCDENHEDFKPYMLNKAGECRATECVSFQSSNQSSLCPTLDTRFVNGSNLLDDYEELIREPCTTATEAEGTIGLCCLRNSTEGALATFMGAEPHEFPHMAKIRHVDRQCGGTIYNKRWVLTAAHCIVTNGEVDDPSKVEVVLGTNIGDQKSSEYVYKVKRVVPHPQYSRLKGNPELEKGENATYFSDIGLLELDRDIEFGEKVKALEIAPEGFDPLEFADKAVIVGWGTTDTLELSVHLQKANFLIRPDEACFGYREEEEEWGPHWNMEGMEDQLLCVGGNMDGKWSPTAGGGDSGGPAICRGPNGKALLCGVTSYGGVDDDCTIHNNEEHCPPSVYAEVAYFSDWINQTAGEQEENTLYKPYLYGKHAPRYPHQVHITSLEGKPCGGTLIAPSVVVTAAQCVATEDGKTRSGVEVTSGVGSLSEAGRTHKVRKISLLPNFTRSGKPVNITSQGNRIRITDTYHKNDLALLRLDRNAKISLEELPQLPVDPEEMPTFGIELAFPRLSPNNSGLMARQYKFVDRTECQIRMNRMSRAGMNIIVDQNILCGVEKYSGGSTCDRELGGGVICEGENGTSVLCGVQVFRLCEWSIPNGFVNMALYREWVEEFIEMSSSSSKLECGMVLTLAFVATFFFKIIK